MEGKVTAIEGGKAIVEIGGVKRAFDAAPYVRPGDVVVVRAGRVEKKQTCDLTSLEVKSWSI